MNERLGIAGTGAIAFGLANAAAAHGDVLLWARSEESAERAESDGLRVTIDLADMADRTLVVEAVVEDLETKSGLLGELGSVLQEQSLLASTTSSLSVQAL